MKILKSGGGFRAIAYTMQSARKVGPWKLWKAMSSRNACKTCALGMGGQKGGMTNEIGHFPEFCKKSIQAMASDMQPAIKLRRFHGDLAKLQKLSPRQLENLGRIPCPLISNSQGENFEKISWEDAFAKVAEKLKATIPDQSFFYFSGRSSNEAGFTLQLLARLYGTNHINNCSYYCHQASGIGLTESIGNGTATTSVEDLEKADCFILFGGNPASNHPRLMSALMRLRARGGSVIIINPLFETGLQNFRVPSDPKSLLLGSEIATIYLKPNIGSDIGVMIGMAKFLKSVGKIDRDFLENCAEGWESVEETIDDTSWDEICDLTGLSRNQIETAAKFYGDSKNAVISWTMGLTHHLHGVQNIHWAANLALMRGMVGKDNAGLLPLRGHSNVQGMGSTGVTPKLKSEIFKRWQERGINVPESEGLDTMSCIDRAAKGSMKVAFCLGGNLYGANPDSAYAEKAFNNLDLAVYLSTTLNTGHVFGKAKETIIFPVLARDEEKQKTTQESMFSYVRLSDGGPSRIKGVRSEVEVITEIAMRLLGSEGPVDWQDLQNHQNIRTLISKLIPDLEKIGSIDKPKKSMDGGGEFLIPGRRLNGPKFPTVNGKAKLHSHSLPIINFDREKYLNLMTVRSEGQFNTVVYEETDLYRGQTSRDIILMNKVDIERLGLKVDQRITVSSDTGRMDHIAVREWDVKSGNAVMYYPEANVLVSRNVDPISRTPAFKSTLIEIK